MPDVRSAEPGKLFLACVLPARLTDLVEGFVVDEELVVEGLVELSARLVGGVEIQPRRIGREFQALIESFSTELEPGARVVQAGLNPCPLRLDSVAALEDLRPIEHAVCGEVDEPLFAQFEATELGREFMVQLARQLGLVVDDLLDLSGDIGAEVGRDAQPLVDPLHRIFDLPDRQVRQVARALLSAAAEVVAVVLAVLAFRLGVDQATSSASLVTALAEQHALEVVEQDAVALTAGRSKQLYL